MAEDSQRGDSGYEPTSGVYDDAHLSRKIRTVAAGIRAMAALLFGDKAIKPLLAADRLPLKDASTATSRPSALVSKASVTN